MKKIIMLMLAVLILTVMASAEVITYTFDTEQKVEEWVTDHSKDVEFSFDSENKGLLAKSIGNDPYISHSFPEDKPLDGNTYKYVVYRFKVVDGLPYLANGQFFFTSDTIKAGKPGSYTSFQNAGKSTWQEVIYDLSSLSWSGNIKMFRFDHVNNAPGSVTVLVHSISFTSTEAEAMELAAALSGKTYVEPVWEFNTYKAVERFEKDMEHIKPIYENGQWILEITDWDPKINFRLNENEKASAESHPYIAFRMKATANMATAGI
ncbi:MAG: hypothetical protein IJO52_03725, partial [Clostridia bacterium]|nr:hypothetical protein [Clostridia bacterium]